MRDCAEGHRAGQPGQTQDRRRTTTKAAKRLLFVLLLLLLPVVITFVVGLGTVCGHGRAELRCASLARQLTVLGSIKRISTELWQSTHAAGQGARSLYTPCCGSSATVAHVEGGLKSSLCKKLQTMSPPL